MFLFCFCFFCFDLVVKIIVLDSIFNIYSFDRRFPYAHNHQAQNWKMNRVRFSNARDSTAINTFYSDKSNISKIKTQHRQFIKIPILIKIPNYTFFPVFPLSKINSFTSITSVVMQHLKYSFIKIRKTKQVQKDYHQDNLPLTIS